MKTKIPLYLFFLMLLAVSACSGGVSSYEQELGVVSNPVLYHKLVDDYPDKALTDLETFIPGIILDIRYATRNNFTGQRIYPSAKAYLRLPAARALQQIQQELNAQGLGVKVFDAYRPYQATLKFYEVYPDTLFVAAPWHGSRHNRGCAIDLTLVRLDTGKELPMPTAFDDFSPVAHHDYSNLNKEILANRHLLLEVMTRNGFEKYPHEWWHYDFVGWENFELLDLSFDDLAEK